MNKILIIDDDRSLLELLQNCMCGLYEMDSAWNGKLYAVSVIMLIAKSSPSDKANGLGIGVDNYVTNPFNVEELLAKAASQIQRNAVLRVLPF